MATVTTGEKHSDCRFWGYEPASSQILFAAKYVDKATRRVEHRENCAKIKAAGFRSSNLGYRTVAEATRVATDIAEASGVDMRVFNHDYL